MHHDKYLFSIMYSDSKAQDTSTPKRRRLGNTKITTKTSKLSQNNNLLLDCSPIRPVTVQNELGVVERCDSPYLPCNQDEFLCESSNSYSTSDIHCPVGTLPKRASQWQSLDVSTSKLCEIYDKTSEIAKNRVVLKEIEDISDDMFESKLEQSVHNHEEKKFKNEMEQSFDVINKSVTSLHEVLKNESTLFDTKDSFLLDIKESGIEKSVQNNLDQLQVHLKQQNIPGTDFYGLPLITKGLFKTYRNIEKFYDWQEECLNLDSIKHRRNLIYALPTSGGKTLVAEVLMLREVLNRKKNALFILPFVAIVQEKIWALSPFAVQLDFLVEEYAAGKGHIPPKKRRKKNSIYVATIEKGLALVRSLIELNRLNELGLIVVDELHLIGEKGRGGTLEMLLSTVIFTNQDIQIVGMSATIGNLHEIARFLRADVFQRQFRPVELAEYVKLGNMLHRIQWGDHGVEVIPDRELTYDYSARALSLDPDALGGLVAEVVPGGSVLVFCPTKRNAENVATLLCQLQRREMTSHRTAERQALERGLRAEGASAELALAVRFGVAFHHAGLASDERVLLEHAFRSGVISVLCCTSTLAAGVNLPARRVIVRAPLVGRSFLSLGAYRQMAGRAGRAGVCDTGESIIICGAREWEQLRNVLRGGLAPARSVLRGGLASLLLSAVALGLATNRRELRELLQCTLMAVTVEDTDESIQVSCDDAVRALLACGALEARAGAAGAGAAPAAAPLAVSALLACGALEARAGAAGAGAAPAAAPLAVSALLACGALEARAGAAGAGAAPAAAPLAVSALLACGALEARAGAAGAGAAPAAAPLAVSALLACGALEARAGAAGAGAAPAAAPLAVSALLACGALEARAGAAGAGAAPAAAPLAVSALLACGALEARAGAAGAGAAPAAAPLAVSALLACGALEARAGAAGAGAAPAAAPLAVSALGRAAIKGCMDLSAARQLLQDLEVASKGLVLMGSLHLLYLVTPHDADAIVRPDYRHYYSLYCNLDEEGVQTARVLGITEMNAVRMMTGRAITTVPEKVLCRFYLALALRELWRQEPFASVANKYCIPRGTVQSVMASSAAFASCAVRFCEEMEPLWPFRALLGELALRLQHCAAPELAALMDLPAVKKARALQLSRAGYKRVEELAKASVDDLTAAVAHLSRTAANQLISAARMTLIEKVENLRAEAEDVMEELNAN